MADAAVKGSALRRAGVLAGILAGAFFLVSVGLNTWASLDYLHQLGWEFVGGEQVPWPSSLARGPYGWAQVASTPKNAGELLRVPHTDGLFVGRAAHPIRVTGRPG